MRERDPEAKLWFRTYQRRISAGLEQCRACGGQEDLIMSPATRAGSDSRLSFETATVLCRGCDDDEDRDVVHLPTLSGEEATAQRERRWSRLARTGASLIHAHRPDVSVEFAPRVIADELLTVLLAHDGTALTITELVSALNLDDTLDNAKTVIAGLRTLRRRGLADTFGNDIGNKWEVTETALSIDRDALRALVLTPPRSTRPSRGGLALRRDSTRAHTAGGWPGPDSGAETKAVSERRAPAPPAPSTVTFYCQARRLIITPEWFTARLIAEPGSLFGLQRAARTH